MIGSRSVYGRAPMRQLHSTPLLSLAVVTPEIKYIRRCHPCTRKCVSQAVLRRMQLTLHAIRRTPSGSSRLVLAMSAWSGKTRRLPSRHCREARVHDHTTAAMHERIHPPPVHPPSPLVKHGLAAVSYIINRVYVVPKSPSLRLLGLFSLNLSRRR